jgi:hypothetical protein
MKTFAHGVIFLLSLPCASIGSAQNIVTTAPFQNTSDSHYEVIGSGFRFDNGSVQFSWQPHVLPQFGRFDPHSAARLNVNSGPLSLSLFGSQGNRRSSVTQAPVLTIPNGGTGFFIDAELRPFVVGFEPVVGGVPPLAAPPILQGPSIQERWEATRSLPKQAAEATQRRIEPRLPTVSSAEFGDISVAEIRRKKGNPSNKVDLLIDKAQQAIDAGKMSVAKNHLRNAARTANGSQRSAIQAELNRIHAEHRDSHHAWSTPQP